MAIKNGFKIALLSLSVMLCSGVCNISQAFAAEDADYRIQISPARNAIENLEPGQEYSGNFEVKNTGNKEIEFETFSTPYSVAGESYDADFHTTNAYTELTKWMTITPETGKIAPNESITIKYVIDVPNNMHGGQQNAAIMIRVTNQDDSNSGTVVQAQGQIGYIIYSNVNGQTTRTGKILENKVPSFLFNPPITASALVENTGNVYTAVTHKLQVFPLFSDEEVYTNEEDPDTNVIFAGTKRYNQQNWDGAPQLGIFRVKSTVKIFDEESVTEKIVFLCPIWFLFVVILMIILIIFWIVSRIIGRKREV